MVKTPLNLDINSENINGFISIDKNKKTYHIYPLRSAIHSAIWDNNFDVVKYLLEYGANPNYLFDGGGEGLAPYVFIPRKTLYLTRYLHYAIYNEPQSFTFSSQKNKDDKFSTKMIQMLIEYGADINAKNEKGDTPLDIAICDHNNTAEDLLRSLGAKTSEEFGSSPIYQEKKEKHKNFLLACEISDIENVKQYFDTDLINGFPDLPASNPLMRSIYSEGNFFLNYKIEDKYYIIDFLIQNGANINSYFDGVGMGRTSYKKRGTKVENKTYILHCAVEAEYLVYRSDLYEKLGGISYFHNISENESKFIYDNHNVPTRIIEILLKHGANVNAKNEKGDTPLDIAIEYGHKLAEEIIRNTGGKTSSELEEESK